MICRAAVDELRSTFPNRGVVFSTSGHLGGKFDRDRVLQALDNLLRNACEHGEGDIHVEARATADDQGVVTKVSNRGPVIPPEVIPKLFDPFARGSSSSKQGLGLGLYIAAQVAMAHGGVCEASSSSDWTSITIHWPRNAASV